VRRSGIGGLSFLVCPWGREKEYLGASAEKWEQWRGLVHRPRRRENTEILERDANMTRQKGDQSGLGEKKKRRGGRDNKLDRTQQIAGVEHKIKTKKLSNAIMAAQEKKDRCAGHVKKERGGRTTTQRRFMASTSDAGVQKRGPAKRKRRKSINMGCSLHRWGGVIQTATQKEERKGTKDKRSRDLQKTIFDLVGKQKGGAEVSYNEIRVFARGKDDSTLVAKNVSTGRVLTALKKEGSFKGGRKVVRRWFVDLWGIVGSTTSIC